MKATISKVAEVFKEGAYRIIKVLQFGAKTADECSPFGFDGNPPADLDAVFMETSNGSEPVIVGYIQTQRLANLGESRLYSLMPDGTLSTYIWLRKDRTIEIGGADDYLVQHSKMKEELILLQQNINKELTKISSGITTAGGVYIPEPIVMDTDKIKTKNIKIMKSYTE
jgi:hypothetical protein